MRMPSIPLGPRSAAYLSLAQIEGSAADQAASSPHAEAAEGFSRIQKSIGSALGDLANRDFALAHEAYWKGAHAGGPFPILEWKAWRQFSHEELVEILAATPPEHLEGSLREAFACAPARIGKARMADWGAPTAALLFDMGASAPILGARGASPLDFEAMLLRAFASRTPCADMRDACQGIGHWLSIGKLLGPEALARANAFWAPRLADARSMGALAMPRLLSPDAGKIPARDAPEQWRLFMDLAAAAESPAADAFALAAIEPALLARAAGCAPGSKDSPAALRLLAIHQARSLGLSIGDGAQGSPSKLPRL